MLSKIQEKIYLKLKKWFFKTPFQKLMQKGGKYIESLYFKANFKNDQRIKISRHNINSVDMGLGIARFNYEKIDYLMHIQPGEAIESTMLLEKVWELDNVKTLDILLSSQNWGLVLDIGANVGSLMMPLAKKYPNLQFLGFEPNPFVANRFQRNIQLNQLENIEIVPFACSDISGKKVKFFAQDYDENNLAGNMGLSGFLPNEGMKNFEEINLETICLDDFLSEKYPETKVSFIKIDTQGSEIEVLKGAKKTIQKYKPSLLVEFEDYHHQNQEDAKKAILDFFEKNQYDLYAANFHLLEYLPKLTLKGKFTGDILAIPR